MITRRLSIEDILDSLEDYDADALPLLGAFGEGDIISTYTRANAIEDGVLFDVSEQARDCGITLHTAMTPGVWAESIAVVGGNDEDNKEAEDERIRQLLSVTMDALQLSSDQRAHFEYAVRRDGQEDAKVALWAMIGPGDDMKPVLTVMLRGED